MMTYQELEKILLSYLASTVSFPFDDTSPVFKVGPKIFAIVGLDKTPLQISLKCAPEDASILRTQFKSIRPGYHLNKDHWNTVTLDGSFDGDLLNKLIDDSYRLVVHTMSKREQKRLGLD